MTAIWLAWRYFGSWRRFFNLSISLSVSGMAIGVASLVVAMAVFSGYVTTLEATVQDAVGHVLVLKRGTADQSELLKDIKPLVPGLLAETPFVYAEAILAHKGQISGILIEGIEDSTVHSVLNLEHRLVKGTLKLGVSEDGLPRVLIGKGIAAKFNVNVGDVIRIVMPLSAEFQANTFRPKLGKFEVAGVLNFGRYDFDSRYILMELAQAQAFAELGERITGYRLKIQNPDQARAIADNITATFGASYWARDWQDVNRYLFEAVQLEKAVLFCVLMVLVVAAAFNIANTLFISVVQRYRDISILKTLGAKDRMIRWVFTFQGLIVGAVGALLGTVVGLLLCRLVEWAQVRYGLIPPEIYRLDHIELQVQLGDLVGIVGVALGICFLATLVPSRRSSKISPVEGLRYE